MQGAEARVPGKFRMRRRGIVASAIRLVFANLFSAGAGFAALALGFDARFAAATLVFLAQLTPAGTVGLGLAGGDRVDPRAHNGGRRPYRQGDEVHRRLGDAAGQRHRKGEEKKRAHAGYIAGMRCGRVNEAPERA